MPVPFQKKMFVCEKCGQRLPPPVNMNVGDGENVIIQAACPNCDQRERLRVRDAVIVIQDALQDTAEPLKQLKAFGRVLAKLKGTKDLDRAIRNGKLPPTFKTVALNLLVIAITAMLTGNCHPDYRVDAKFQFRGRDGNHTPESRSTETETAPEPPQKRTPKIAKPRRTKTRDATQPRRRQE